MASNVSDFILSRLKDWKVKRIFGYPGDGINGIMGALQRSPEEIRFIPVRHEESAAFMATGHSAHPLKASEGLYNGYFERRQRKSGIIRQTFKDVVESFTAR